MPPEPTPTPAPEPTPQPTPGGVTLEQIGSLIDAKLNGLDKRYSKEFKTIQERLGVPNPEPTPTPDPNPNPADPKTRQLEAQMKKLQDQLDGEKKARETAETRGRNADRDRAVQQALSGFQFAMQPPEKTLSTCTRRREMVGGRGARWPRRSAARRLHQSLDGHQAVSVGSP
jgi:hypothetical protein